MSAMENTSQAPFDLGLPGATPVIPSAADNARVELEALKANPEWVKKHLAGDHNTKADVERLSAIIAAPRAGATMHGGPTVEEQRSEMANYVESMGVSPGVVKQVREGISETDLTYKQAVGLKRRLISDPAFVAKYMAGDHEA